MLQFRLRGFLGRSSTLEQVEWVDRHLPAVTWTEELKIMRMRRAIWFRQWNQVYSLYDQLSENSRTKSTGVTGKLVLQQKLAKNRKAEL